MFFELRKRGRLTKKRHLILPSGFLILLMILIAGTFVFQPVAAQTIEANVVLDPEKINLSNLPSDFINPYMVATISFPKAVKDQLVNINASTVLLNGVIPLSTYDSSPGKFKAFFDKDVTASYLWTLVYHMGYFPPFKNQPVVLTVTGNLYDGTPFSGSDTVYVSAR